MQIYKALNCYLKRSIRNYSNKPASLFKSHSDLFLANSIAVKKEKAIKIIMSSSDTLHLYR